MDLEKLIKSVEEKTGEEIISVTGSRQKPSKMQKVKCLLGFHTYDIKSGQGFFTDNQCIHCWNFRKS